MISCRYLMISPNLFFATPPRLAALCAPFVGAFIVPRLFPAREKAGRPYTRASVEGLIVGLVLGYFVPSYFLLFSTGDKRQGWVAGWQFLPVWLWVGQEGWKRVRRTIDASGERRAGKTELQALGALCGLSSLAGHAVVLVSRAHSTRTVAVMVGLTRVTHPSA